MRVVPLGCSSVFTASSLIHKVILLICGLWTLMVPEYSHLMESTIPDNLDPTSMVVANVGNVGNVS